MRDGSQPADASSTDRTARIGDAEVAAALRAGLVAGLFSHERVVAWADGRVEEEARPAEWLIELATARDVNTAVEVLCGPERGADVDVVLKLVVSAIRRRTGGARDAERIARLIRRVSYDLLIDAESGAWAVYNEAVHVELDFDMVRYGMLSEDFRPRILADLRDLLRRHALPTGAPDPLSNL